MTAKEMFEKLGYEIDTTNDRMLRYGKGYTAKIEFDLIYHNFYKYNDSGFRSPIDIELLQAINKQVEELGWK